MREPSDLMRCYIRQYFGSMCDTSRDFYFNDVNKMYVNITSDITLIITIINDIIQINRFTPIVFDKTNYKHKLIEYLNTYHNNIQYLVRQHKINEILY